MTCSFWLTCLTGGLEAWTKATNGAPPETRPLPRPACPRAAETCPAPRN